MGPKGSMRNGVCVWKIPKGYAKGRDWAGTQNMPSINIGGLSEISGTMLQIHQSWRRLFFLLAKELKYKGYGL